MADASGLQNPQTFGFRDILIFFFDKMRKTNFGAKELFSAFF
jgi:hypothetical protein